MWHLRHRILRTTLNPWNWNNGSNSLSGNGNNSRSTDSYSCAEHGVRKTESNTMRKMKD